MRFFSQNIHKSNNIKDFFDIDAPLIINGSKAKKGAGAGDVNSSVEELTAANKLKPLYDTYKTLKTHYEGMPITESNICTLLDEARGKREKDMNNIFSDGGIPLLQNFAKFCLWLNWYTSIPRNKTAVDAAKHFDNILGKCFLGLLTAKTIPETPPEPYCVRHKSSDQGTTFNLNTNPNSNRQINTSVTGSSSRPGSRQRGAVDRNPKIRTAGLPSRGMGGGKKTKRLHKKKRGKWTRHCKKKQTRPLRKKKVKPTKKK